jgi:Post-segregation antitoxin CcdA
MQMAIKGNVVLYLDKELVEKSKNLGFNLSKTFENHLKHLITGYSPVSTQNNGNLTIHNSKWWAEPDSDRRPSARQADVLTRLDDRPTVCIFFYDISLYRHFVL